MEKWFKQSGSKVENVRNAAPHLMFGKEGFSMAKDERPKDFPIRHENLSPERPITPKISIPEPTEDLINSLKKWGTIIIIAIVVVYAIYRLFN